MDVLTVAQARERDRMAIEERGMPGAVLMENAGRAVVEVIGATCGSLRGLKVAVVCGAGNNGGDGFVVARHLVVEGAKAVVYLVGDPESLKGDAALNYKLLPAPALPAPEGDAWAGLRAADVLEA
jgi:NAD(P)H-hydrate epimerase